MLDNSSVAIFYLLHHFLNTFKMDEKPIKIGDLPQNGGRFCQIFSSVLPVIATCDNNYEIKLYFGDKI